MNDMTDRQQFYDQIGNHSLAPLWERLHAMVTRTPVTPALPNKWDYDNVVRPYPHAGRQPDHREGSRAPRADPGKSRPARAKLDHPFAVRRAATDHARRSGARASPYPVGAALHHRRPRRLHRR